MDDSELAKRFLFISFFMISAAIIEIVDLGLDRAVSQLSASSFNTAFVTVSFVEFISGVVATLLAGYSLDRMFILMRKKLGKSHEAIQYRQPLKTRLNHRTLEERINAQRISSVLQIRLNNK